VPTSSCTARPSTFTGRAGAARSRRSMPARPVAFAYAGAEIAGRTAGPRSTTPGQPPPRPATSTRVPSAGDRSLNTMGLQPLGRPFSAARAGAAAPGFHLRGGRRRDVSVRWVEVNHMTCRSSGRCCDVVFDESYPSR
jgi:hypothetical protein